MWRGSGVQAAAFAALFAVATTAHADDREALDRAQKLAWNKQFADAEGIYREVLAHGQSHEAALGLARVRLWEGHYADARKRFLALGDPEGAATAAYWQGDFRTAAREFRGVDSQFARDSLAAIAQSEGPTDRIGADWQNDDQPFRALNSMASSSWFSDPLTRWDVAAGTTALSAPRFSAQRQLPFVTIANETGLPWERLTLGGMLGLRRFGDGSTRPIGSASMRYRMSSNASASAIVEHRELLTNATGLSTHPSVTRGLINWTRYRDRSWLAGFEAGSLRYFDKNRGRYAQGYVLVPVLVGQPKAAVFHFGISGAVRDTAENRFYIDAVSGSRTAAGDFQYDYRGSYTPYWTPKHLREARAIALVTGTAKRATWKVQLETGIAHDTVLGFGPATGPTPLPANIFTFDFRRTSHPARGAISFSAPIASRFEVEVGVERNTTAFYAANSIHASLVRHR